MPLKALFLVLKKKTALSAPTLGLNTIIFKHVYWYMQQTQVSVYRTIGPLVLILVQNIECGYSLEPPRRDIPNVYPQCFEQES